MFQKAKLTPDTGVATMLFSPLFIPYLYKVKKYITFVQMLYVCNMFVTNGTIHEELLSGQYLF